VACPSGKSKRSSPWRRPHRTPPRGGRARSHVSATETGLPWIAYGKQRKISSLDLIYLGGVDGLYISAENAGPVKRKQSSSENILVLQKKQPSEECTPPKKLFFRRNKFSKGAQRKRTLRRNKNCSHKKMPFAVPISPTNNTTTQDRCGGSRFSDDTQIDRAVRPFARLRTYR